MTGIIVAFPKLDDAKNIKKLLVRSGHAVLGICTSGAQAIQYADGLDRGIIVCGYKLTDMLYQELYECLPPSFEMLLVASGHVLNACYTRDIISLAMPVKAYDLVNTADMMVQAMDRKRKRQKAVPTERKEEEKELIVQAKKLLMERNHMTEEEAHRYIQKCSMDSSTNMVETARMVLSLMKR